MSLRREREEGDEMKSEITEKAHLMAHEDNGYSHEEGIGIGAKVDVHLAHGQSHMGVEEAVEMLGWGPFHWQLMIQCGLAWACDAMEMMLLSFLVPRVVEVFMPDADKTTAKVVEFSIGAVTFGGIWIGCILFGKLSDRYGRKKGYLISTMLVSVFGLLCALAPNIHVLVFLRFMVGIGLGGVTCAITLFTELVGAKYRGMTIILSIGSLWTLGCLYETGIAWICFTMPGIQWRLFLLLSAVPSTLLLAIFPWLVESPRYYMITNQESKALDVLHMAAKRNGRELPESLKLIHPAKVNTEGQLKVLFNKEFRVTTVLLWGLWFVSVISYYGLSFVTPLYFAYQNQNEYLVTFLSALAEIPGLVVTSLLVDRVGRKKTKAIMYSIAGISTMILSVTSLPFGVLALCAVIARGSVEGAFNDLYVYTPEVYPTFVRTFGLGMCSSVARIAGIIVSYISFQSETGAQASFAVKIYGIAALIGVVLSIALPIETKGKKLSDESED